MTRGWFALLLFATLAMAQTEMRTRFEVRYIASGAVYLSGGREEGLQEGFRLRVKRLKPGEPELSAKTITQLVVTAVAAHSAVCSIETPDAELQIGDIAEVVGDNLELLQALQQSKSARHYAQVVTFTEGDPLEQEQRDYLPRPRLPEVNRARGLVSYEFNNIADRNAGYSTTQNGVVVRADVTRIAGTYWNFTGYWRGRLNSSFGASAQTQTLHDLLNRTYHIGLYYNNPGSKYVIGVGRVFLPWAPNLSTIDGGYLGRRVGKYATLGAFGGSTPDPTAWDYKPGRQMGGSFVAVDAGSFDNVRFSGTAGIALTRLHWQAEREFAFVETSFNWKRYLAVFHNLEEDRLTAGRLGNTQSGAALSRSFLTVRLQPVSWLAIDVNHNYFRNVPTFDTLLLGTGLLDRYLFTGLSAGLRVELPLGVAVYGSMGQNQRTGDARGSLNQMYGIAFRNVLQTRMRADLRHSVFHGPFGDGWYQSVSLSREVGERMQFEIEGGDQELQSLLSGHNRGFWMNSNVNRYLGAHYVVGAGVSLFRGSVQSYDQTFLSFGYRY